MVANRDRILMASGWPSRPDPEAWLRSVHNQAANDGYVKELVDSVYRRLAEVHEETKWLEQPQEKLDDDSIPAVLVLWQLCQFVSQPHTETIHAALGHSFGAVTVAYLAASGGDVQTLIRGGFACDAILLALTLGKGSAQRMSSVYNGAAQRKRTANYMLSVRNVGQKDLQGCLAGVNKKVDGCCGIRACICACYGQGMFVVSGHLN
eukprot:3076596-Amphidinium_carterae.1